MWWLCIAHGEGSITPVQRKHCLLILEDKSRIGLAGTTRDISIFKFTSMCKYIDWRDHPRVEALPSKSTKIPICPQRLDTYRFCFLRIRHSYTSLAKRQTGHLYQPYSSHCETMDYQTMSITHLYYPAPFDYLFEPTSTAPVTAPATATAPQPPEPVLKVATSNPVSLPGVLNSTCGTFCILAVWICLLLSFPVVRFGGLSRSRQIRSEVKWLTSMCTHI